MSPDTDIRTHVILPRSLIVQIDRLVGARGRSRFVRDAVARELAHRALVAAAEQAMGSARGETRPWGDTPAAIARWVHDDRQASLDDDVDPVALAGRDTPR